MGSNILQVVRGDSLKFKFSIDADCMHAEINALVQNPYDLTSTDCIYLGIMEPHQPFEFALLKRKYIKINQENHLITVNIPPSDTISLLPGVYYYCLKLRQNPNTEEESVITILNKTKLLVDD